MSNGPVKRPRRLTATCSAAASPAAVRVPSASGCPALTPAAIRSVTSSSTRVSGSTWSMAPISRSIRPSRSAGPASHSSASTRSETPGARRRASPSSPGVSAAPTRSAAWTVKVRRIAAGSIPPLGVSSASSRRTTAAASSRSSSARGVGTIAWPARTRSGSWSTRRSRARVRLIAAGEVRSRAAARVTLCSARRASRATASWASRFGAGLLTLLTLLTCIFPFWAMIGCRSSHCGNAVRVRTMRERYRSQRLGPRGFS